jgi:hypothetical protein
MGTDILDNSNYFKGLLLLARKDNEVNCKEKEALMAIGKKLGFDKKFCSNAIKEILVNEYIIDKPPKFSKKEIAEKFIKDGIKFALVDNNLHSFELEWLKQVANKNELKTNIIDETLKQYIRNKDDDSLSDHEGYSKVVA